MVRHNRTRLWISALLAGVCLLALAGALLPQVDPGIPNRSTLGLIESLTIGLLMGTAAILTFLNHKFAPAILAVLAIQACVELVVEAFFPTSSFERSIDLFQLLLFAGSGVYVYRINGRNMEPHSPVLSAAELQR